MINISIKKSVWATGDFCLLTEIGWKKALFYLATQSSMDVNQNFLDFTKLNDITFITKQHGGIVLTLGEKIKEFRKRAGLSQEQLADKLSVSRQAITKWENDRGMPDINNLQCIANLFDVSIDSLVNRPEDITSIVIKEDIDIENYQKTGKFRSKYDAAVREKYPNASVIYPLIRRKKLNLAQDIVDFIVQPGVLQVADSFNDLSSYYLVELNNKQLLVRVTKTFIEGRELHIKFDGKKCIIDGNVFRKATYTI